jgi:hypothetical protein
MSPRSAVSRLAFASLLSLSAGALSLPAAAQDELPFKLRTHESLIQDLKRRSSLDISDLMAVFEAVFRQLPGEATIYPTENYYYFSFIHNGQPYAGNLRLDESDRDKGILHFAYFPEYTEWFRGDDPEYKALKAEDGVRIEKEGDLEYRVTFKDKSVLFRMVDLRGVKPPAELLHANEEYLGPVFDDAGIQFYLVFNRDLKVFHYILNDRDGAGDTLVPSEVARRIEIGRRSGFAFYRDHYLDRRILIGVHQHNSNVNNYNDGPFDQLPDNFIAGDKLKDAILAAAPYMEGRIDRLGNSANGEERFFIGPYITWETQTDLSPFNDCADSKDTPREVYYACFSMDPGSDFSDAGQEGGTPQGDDAARSATAPNTEKSQ